ncbi:SDR family NAD(P)-dependent oxidoreductase [Foliimonas ilicis]
MRHSGADRWRIASISGIRASVSRVAYGSSKAGMLMMTQIMAVEFATHGVRVNAIAPGPIETTLVLAGPNEALRPSLGNGRRRTLPAR